MSVEEPRDKIVHVRITSKIQKKIANLATADRRSMSDWCSLALERVIEQTEQPEKKK